MQTFDDLLPIVEKISRDLYFMYGVDHQEGQSLLLEEISSRPEDYLILLREGRQGIIELRFKNLGSRHARAERIKKSAQDGEYWYDPEYIRLFLPFYFAYEDWENGPIPEDATSKWRTGEAIDTALDIKAAWPRLKPWQGLVILARHVDVAPNGDAGVDWEAIAVVCGWQGGASAQSRYADATRELTFEMNNCRARRIDAHDGPGSRRVISNAAALAGLDT